MTPDSIVLLSPDAKLDALIYALGLARAQVQARLTLESLEASTAAWEALHGELMGQLSHACPVSTAGAKEAVEAADTKL